MEEIHVLGKSSLKGSVSVQGSKNAALPMMAASLLHRGISVLKGCPAISDVFCMEEILRSLGAVTWWKDHDLYLDCTNAEKTEIPAFYTGKMRSSVILLAPVLSRNKTCSIGYPGGCVIGKRPVDLHLMALRNLGVRILETQQLLIAHCENMTGAEIIFPRSSVGATQQALLAAVLAQGETVLINCAREPEIVWLCRYLRSMGARIEGEGSSTVLVHGVKELGPGNFKVPPDRIVAGTYICAAAATGSEIELKGVLVEELGAFLEVYRKIGGQYEAKSGTLMVNGKEAVHPVELVETGAYPGFPTDLQSPLTAVLIGIPGRSTVRENVFEDRFQAAFQMKKMGAHIEINGRDAVIEGGISLSGCVLQAKDLRGGAALILAAMQASGETCIRGANYIRRGYEHICEDLESLGCEIWQT